MRHRSVAIAAAGLCLLGLDLALGRYGFVYELLAQAPYPAQFRAPTRHIMLVHFGLAILSAVAIDDLIACARRRDRLPFGVFAALVAPIALSVVAGLIAVQFLQDAPGVLVPPTWIRLMVGAALMGATTRLVVLSARGARPALLMLPLFAAISRTISASLASGEVLAGADSGYASEELGGGYSEGCDEAG